MPTFVGVVDWDDTLALARSRWRARTTANSLTITTEHRYLRVFESFARYAAAHGATACGAVSPELCRNFCGATLRESMPSASTRRFRLTVVRDAYRELRAAGMAGHDPTAGLRIDWRVGRPVVCPLTPMEAHRLLAAGRTGATDTLRPAVVALALSGGSHREIAEAAAADVAFEAGQWRIGATNGRARTVPMATGGLLAARVRVAALRLEWRRLRRPWDPRLVPLAMHRPVAEYPANSVAALVSVNLSRALDRAGIRRPGVRPRSVREYAANRTYALTNRVEDVAALLGLVSLDAAARLVDPEWQHRWAAHERAADTDE